MGLWNEKEQERIREIARARENEELEKLRSPEGSCIGCRLFREKNNFKMSGFVRREDGENIYRSAKRRKGEAIPGYCFRPSGVCETEKEAQ